MSVKKLKSELLVVVRDRRDLSQKIDRLTKRGEQKEESQTPKKTKTVGLGEFPEIDPAILAHVIRGKIYPSDIILAHIIANPDGIEIVTLEKKTKLKYDTIKQILHRLRTQGKIRSKRKEGLRGKAYAAGMSRSLYFEA